MDDKFSEKPSTETYKVIGIYNPAMTLSLSTPTIELMNKPNSI